MGEGRPVPSPFPNSSRTGRRRRAHVGPVGTKPLDVTTKGWWKTRRGKEKDTTYKNLSPDLTHPRPRVVGVCPPPRLKIPRVPVSP